MEMIFAIMVFVIVVVIVVWAYSGFMNAIGKVGEAVVGGWVRGGRGGGVITETQSGSQGKLDGNLCAL